MRITWLLLVVVYSSLAFGQGKGFPEDKTPVTITYADAAKLQQKGSIQPGVWYYLADEKLYLTSLNGTSFNPDGYYQRTASALNQVQYDFENRHIYLERDQYGNEVGANFDFIQFELVSVDPRSVFKWNDRYVQDNKVINAVMRFEEMDGYYLIVGNEVKQSAEMTIGSYDSLTLLNNTLENWATWSMKYARGTVVGNKFTDNIWVNMDSINAFVQGNEMGGSEDYFIITGAKGNYLSNKGSGHLRCIGCGPQTNIRSTNFTDGAYLYADSCNADINANRLQRGAMLHMERSDSAFSKNVLDFTVVVWADGNKNRTEYNRFTSCGYGYGVHFTVRMSGKGKLQNSTIYSCESVFLDADKVYNNLHYDSRNMALGSIQADSTLTIVGGLALRNGSESKGYVLTSDLVGGANWTNPHRVRVINAFEGERVFVDSDVHLLVLEPDSILWNYSIIFPEWPIDGQKLEIVTIKNDILNMVIMPANGQRIWGPATELKQYQSIVFYYDGKNSRWIKTK